MPQASNTLDVKVGNILGHLWGIQLGSYNPVCVQVMDSLDTSLADILLNRVHLGVRLHGCKRQLKNHARRLSSRVNPGYGLPGQGKQADPFSLGHIQA